MICILDKEMLQSLNEGRSVGGICSTHGETRNSYTGFEILTAAVMNMAFVWVVSPCSLVEITNVSEVLTASIIRAKSHRLKRW
jgi:hypothetical protein